MTAQKSPEDLIRAVFAATDAQDVDAIESLVTDDVRMQFGSGEPSVGKAAFLAGARQFHRSIGAIQHQIDRLWTVGDDVVITEMLVHYKRLDGGELTLPCANIFYLRDGLVQDYRIYMDINPVYAEKAGV